LKGYLTLWLDMVQLGTSFLRFISGSLLSEKDCSQVRAMDVHMSDAHHIVTDECA